MSRRINARETRISNDDNREISGGSSLPWTTFIAGSGFLADSYDLFVIDLVMAMLLDLNINVYKIPVSTSDLSSVAAATLVGAVCGQLGFGTLADLFGRRVLFLITSIIVTVTALLSSAVQWTPSLILPFNIFKQLALCRFLLGIGIGGEYPLAAAVSSETAPNRKKKHVAAVFSMQGVGMVISPTIVYCCLHWGLSLERTWRTCLAFGALPSATVAFFRYKMKESMTYRDAKIKNKLMSVASTVPPPTTYMQVPVSYDGNEESCRFAPPVHEEKERLTGGKQVIEIEDDKSLNPRGVGDTINCENLRSWFNKLNLISWFNQLNLRSWFNQLRLSNTVKRQLIGTALSWALLDITLYGTASFKSQITESYTGRSSTNMQAINGDIHQIKSDALISIFIALLSFPGYILTFMFVDRIDLKKLQLIGFALLSLSFSVLAMIFHFQRIPNSSISTIVFSLTFFFSNFGPNATTFILPTQLFPILIKGTCHGISAAAGKLGGVIGASMFPVIMRYTSISVVMLTCAITSFCGALVTIYCIDDAI